VWVKVKLALLWQIFQRGMIPNPFSMIHGGSAFGGADHGRRELDRKEELAPLAYAVSVAIKRGDRNVH
jgi:hypothetical protein